MLSPKQGASPGDLFIEQQAHSILQRHGIRVRERLARDEPFHRGQTTEEPAYNQSYLRYYPHSQSLLDGPVKQQQLTRSEKKERHDMGCQSYFSMGSESTSRNKQEIQEVVEEMEGKHVARTEGLLRSRKAVLPSEIRRKERNTDDSCSGSGDNREVSSAIAGHRSSEGAANDPRGWHGSRARREVYTEHVSRLQAAESLQARAREAHRRPDASCCAPIQTSSARPMTNSSKPMDTGNTQKTVLPIQEPIREAVQQEKVPNVDHLSHDARVSVAHLRHTYLQSVASPRKAELSHLSSEPSSPEDLKLPQRDSGPALFNPLRTDQLSIIKADSSLCLQALNPTQHCKQRRWIQTDG